jgi:hypothetical protein
VTVLRDRELCLLWPPRFRRRGDLPGGDIAPPRRAVLAAVGIDLKTGKVRSLEGEKMPPRSADVKLSGPVGEQVARLLQDETIEQRQVVVTARRVALAAVYTVEDEQERVKLYRWDLKTGRTLPAQELLRGEGVRLAVSLDGHTILVGRTPHGGVPAVRFWHAYAAETGKELATFETPSGRTTVTALGELAFWVESTAGGRRGEGPPPPRSATLRAVDLKTGKTLWERPIVGGFPGRRPLR